MSPLEIEILLHYYCTGGVDYPRLTAPAVVSSIAHFVEVGVLVDNGPSMMDPMSKGIPAPRYVANRDALEPWVAAVTALPLPVRRWVMP